MGASGHHRCCCVAGITVTFTGITPCGCVAGDFGNRRRLFITGDPNGTYCLPPFNSNIWRLNLTSPFSCTIKYYSNATDCANDTNSFGSETYSVNHITYDLSAGYLHFGQVATPSHRALFYAAATLTPDHEIILTHSQSCGWTWPLAMATGGTATVTPGC